MELKIDLNIEFVFWESASYGDELHLNPEVAKIVKPVSQGYGELIFDINTAN